MMKRYALLVTLAATMLLPAVLPAQTVQWLYNYDSPGHLADEARWDCLVRAPNGNLFVGGHVDYGHDAFIAGLTPEGAERWHYTWNPGRDDLIGRLLRDSAGNLYAAIATWTNTWTDWSVLSLDDTGALRWIWWLQETGDQRLLDMALGSDGNLYLTGSGPGFAVASLTSDSGKLRWRRGWDPGGGYNEGYGITCGANSVSYAAGGVWNSTPGHGYDLAVISRDDTGHLRWTYTYHGGISNGEDWGYTIVRGTDGNLYVAGYSAGSGTGADFLVVSLDDDGGERWVYRRDGTRHINDRCPELIWGLDGNVYVVGYENADTDSMRLVVVSLTSAGSERWTYSLPQWSTGGPAAFGADGNLYVSGYRYNGWNKDLLVLCFSSAGALQWNYQWDQGSDEWGNAIVCGPDASVFVSGLSHFPSPRLADLVVLKLVSADVGCIRILAPTGMVDSGAVITPRAIVRNYCAHDLRFPVRFWIGDGYTDVESVALAAGGVDTVECAPWTADSLGSYPVRCSTELIGDRQPGNDRTAGSVTVRVQRGVAGWARLTDLPAGPKGKNVKDGGCIAYKPDSTGWYIYALKGNGGYEFYRYDLDANTWATKESIPAIGRAGKKKAVKKGAAMCAVPYVCDGDGGAGDNDKIGDWMVKGNNSLEFWRYDPRLSGTDIYPWAQRADVPAGTRTIREGAGLVRVPNAEAAWVFLLKGSGTQEFYRHNNATDEWARMADAPLGLSGKTWKNGSCIAYDESRNLIYALKGSYNELFVYDLDSNRWIPKASLPLIGSMGKKKKVKDGAGLTYTNGLLYAIKGGNTRELWAYAADTNKWTQLEDEPLGGGKNVKGGGALVAADGALYALKGNNTLEFFRYGLSAYSSRLTANGPEVQSSLFNHQSSLFNLRVSPNPWPGNELPLAISYSLPSAGSISLKLYDITGKLVATLAKGHRPAGSFAFSVSRSAFSSGIYILKLEAETSTATTKLIVE